MRPFTQNVEHDEENIMNEKIKKYFFFVATLMGYVFRDDGWVNWLIVGLLDDLCFREVILMT